MINIFLSCRLVAATIFVPRNALDSNHGSDGRASWYRRTLLKFRVHFRTWGKARLRNIFEIGQRFGFDVLPRHFYSEIPDIRALKQDDRWQRAYSLVGVAGTDIDQQLCWLREICPPELASTLPSLHLQQKASEINSELGYGPIEADLLYSFIRTRSPRRMIQVGAGTSTWVALQAARAIGADIEITCIDPFPNRYLRQLEADQSIRLLDVPVQAVSPGEFAGLVSGDVLFIDSTHTVSTGSDVNYLILEILPRLRKGVFVHFHDVTMPYDYFPDLLSRDLFFWRESVLLHAFLIDNPRFKIRLGCAMLHDAALDRVQEIIPTYDSPMKTKRGLAVGSKSGAFPSSIWLEVVADREENNEPHD